MNFLLGASANQLMTLGVLAYEHGKSSLAIRLFRQASTQSPSQRTFHWLGKALWRAGAFREAADAFARAQEYGRSSALARNMDLLRMDRERDKLARGILRRDNPGRGSPMNVGYVLKLASALARQRVEAPARARSPQRSARLSFVMHRRDRRDSTRCEESLARAFARVSREYIPLDLENASAAYRTGLERARGEFVVFCTDDIEVLDDGFAEGLLDACEGADVVGYAGTTLLCGPMLTSAGSPHVHGAFTELRADGRYWLALRSVEGPRVDGAQALDDGFIAVRRDVALALGFDAENFAPSSYSVLDFSYRAWKCGFRVRIQSDLHVLRQRVHPSVSDRSCIQRFESKHSEFAAQIPRSLSTVREVPLSSGLEARLAQRWVMHWLDSSEEELRDDG